MLVTGPGEENIADTLFFGRKLQEAGYRLGPIVVNRLHLPTPASWSTNAAQNDELQVGRDLLTWLGERDSRGFERLVELVHGEQPVLRIPILAEEPSDLPRLRRLSTTLSSQL